MTLNILKKFAKEVELKSEDVVKGENYNHDCSFQITNYAKEPGVLLFEIEYFVDLYENHDIFVEEILVGKFLIKKNYKKKTEEYIFLYLSSVHRVLTKEEYEKLKKEVFEEFKNSKEYIEIKKFEMIIEKPKKAFKDNLLDINYDEEKDDFYVGFSFNYEFEGEENGIYRLFIVKLKENEKNEAIIEDIIFYEHVGSSEYEDDSNEVLISLMDIFPDEESLEIFKQNLVLKKLFKKI